MLCENRGNGVAAVGALRVGYHYFEDILLLVCATMGLLAGVMVDRLWAMSGGGV